MHDPASKAAMAKVIVEEILGAQKRAEPPKTKDVQARILTDLLSCVLRPNPFQVGDLVEQVPAFERYGHPRDGELAIVTDIGPQDKPESDDTIPRFDMRILVNSRDTWVEFAVESWRFRKYEGPIA